MLRALTSHRMEDLLSQLKDSLFSHSSLFTKRLVIVPSPLMKSWVMRQMAQEKDLHVAMGMQICHLQQAFSEIRSWEEADYGKRKKALPRYSDMVLLLYGSFQKVLSHFASFDEEQKKVWKPVVQFLQLASFEKKDRFRRRLIKLCEELTPLFLQYGMYGEELIKTWEQRPEICWQALLWKEIFHGKGSNWTYPLREVKEAIQEFSALSSPSLSHKQVDLFGFSFLSPLHHQFFQEISQKIPVHYFLLSPTQGFWSDVASDATLEHWADRQGSAILDQEAYFSDRNGLVANWGKVGKWMMQQLEASLHDVEEIFSFPSLAFSHPVYAPYLHQDFQVFPSKRGGLTLLEAVQMDMALMRNPTQEEPLGFEQETSIQIHFSPSRRREVEVVLDLLLNLIQKHRQEGSPLFPQEILVMAPDVMEYLPHIEAIFGSEECPLHFQLFDLKPQIRQPLIKDFWHLLQLAKSRWEVVDVMQIFESSFFQRRFGLSGEDVQQLYGWVEKSEIRWGYDQKHRKDLYPSLLEEETGGTWEEGLQRLLLGGILQLPQEAAEITDSLPDMKMLPTVMIEGSQFPLLSQWIQILRSLYHDLHPLNSDHLMTLQEWGAYLHRLYSTYFQIPSVVSEGNEAQEKLLAAFQALLKLPSLFQGEEFHWDIIRHFLEKELSKDLFDYKETEVQAVRFCSMLPMRAIPAKVIVLMGMGEENFPKKEKKSLLDMMQERKDRMFCPSIVDSDHFLFLEAILSAREALIMTNSTMISSPKGDTWTPSSCISEFISYLDKGYLLNGSLPSSQILHIHPFNGFDRQYFEKPSSLLPSFSKRRFAQAEAYYGKKLSKGPLYPIPSVSFSEHSAEELIIEIRKLEETVRHPVRFYCQRTLGLYLDKETPLHQKAEEDFVMPFLENYLLKREAQQHSVDHAWSWAGLKGQLPTGLFKNLLYTQLQANVAENQRGLNLFGLSDKEIFFLELRIDCRHPFQHPDGHWTLPPLEFHLENGIRGKIIGKLPELSKKGALVLVKGKEKGDEKEFFLHWPRCILLEALLKKHPALPLMPRLLFLKNGKEKEMTLMEGERRFNAFLNYHLEAKRQISWLMPDAIKNALEKNGEKFWKSVQAKEDPYIAWALEREFSDVKKDTLFSQCCEHLHHFFI